MHSRLLIVCTILFGCSTVAGAEKKEGEFTKRGPLDKHAALVQGVLDTLDLTKQQKPQLAKIVAEGHAAWRAWYKKNHEKVDAYAEAVRKVKESGDKEELKKVRKEKKAFMHTAPSLLRQPEPVRPVLTEPQRKLFDERLQKLKEDLHRPAKKQPSE